MEGNTMRAIALFIILSLTSCVIAGGFMAANTPASANKMDGKPGGGRNVANYGPQKTYSKPPAKTKKSVTQQ
jgi:hypothetical protein